MPFSQMPQALTPKCPSVVQEPCSSQMTARVHPLTGYINAHQIERGGSGIWSGGSWLRLKDSIGLGIHLIPDKGKGPTSCMAGSTTSCTHVRTVLTCVSDRRVSGIKHQRRRHRGSTISLVPDSTWICTFCCQETQKPTWNWMFRSLVQPEFSRTTFLMQTHLYCSSSEQAASNWFAGPLMHCLSC